MFNKDQMFVGKTDVGEILAIRKDLIETVVIEPRNGRYNLTVSYLGKTINFVDTTIEDLSDLGISIKKVSGAQLK